MMKQRSSLPLFSTRLTATVSVGLVLLILGATALAAIGAHALVADIQRHMGFVVVLDDNASAADADCLKQRFARAPYAHSYSYASPADIMDRWQRALGDTEDLMALTDSVVPFAPEFEVYVRPRWASPDSLAAIAATLEMAPGVSEVRVHNEIVEQVHSVIRAVGIGAAAVAGVLLVIAFVLINNAVRLTVYARRFTIHTMRLVGATGAFIRRPIVAANTLAGAIAGAAAAAVLASLLAVARDADPAVGAAVPWLPACAVFGAMVACGALLTMVAATLATNKHLRQSHDDMFG